MQNDGAIGNEAVDSEVFSHFAERLKLAIGKEPLKTFARRASMSDTAIRRYLLEGAMPSIDKAYRLAVAAGVDFAWLCTGKGEVPLADGVPLAGSPVAEDSWSDFTLIDSYAVFASAGHGTDVGHELQTEPMSFRTDWLKREGLAPERLAVIRAKGDSMEPTISDNDVILVLLTNGDAPRDGLHVIRLDSGLFVKRVQFDPLGSVHVMSDNPAYSSIVVKKEDRDQLFIIGRVVWAGKKF